ncbi:hypothetical protein, partial [Xylanibacter rodentium]|uniref:hypothetical protein n=1 Tax=Xylanibacter rodentium TaxID=2736289 RepID=UPI00258A593D
MTKHFVVRHKNDFCRLRAENSAFFVKTGSADYQALTFFKDQYGYVKKAERAVSPCNKAVIALR